MGSDNVHYKKTVKNNMVNPNKKMLKRAEAKLENVGGALLGTGASLCNEVGRKGRNASAII